MDTKTIVGIAIFYVLFGAIMLGTGYWKGHTDASRKYNNALRFADEERIRLEAEIEDANAALSETGRNIQDIITEAGDANNRIKFEAGEIIKSAKQLENGRFGDGGSGDVDDNSGGDEK